MSQSTDALIAWGIALGDEDEIPEWVWRLANVKDTRATVDRYAAIDELESALKNKGLELLRHCYHECVMYILAMKGSEMRAGRGSVACIPIGKFDSESPSYRYKWSELARVDDCAPKRTSPGWILFSWWG